jgi:segregation and condensation protein A
MESTQENVYRRTAPKLEFDAPAQRLQISIFDLVNAVNVILKRFTPADTRDIFEDKWTVSEKIEAIVNLIRERPAVKFSELFAAATSRTEVVVTFLAMLELIRLKQIVIAQPEAFSEIEIAQAPPQPVGPPPEPAAENPPGPAPELNLRMN